jgi:DNA-binding MarR family transcriptional regulator
MPTTVPKRQYAVKSTPVRPTRTAAGDAFTSLVVQVARLGGEFTAIGERLAALADLTLAHWIVLDAAEDGPASVAQISRQLGMARQSVQRVADLLVRSHLAVYRSNPDHRRAKLLCLTADGRVALVTIARAQKTWADTLGSEIGEAELRKVRAMLERIQRVTSQHSPMAIETILAVGSQNARGS